MQATAFDRARGLMGTQSGAVLRARVLGVFESLICLLLFLIHGLLLVLLTTRGEGVISRRIAAEFPAWVESRVVEATPIALSVEDAGLSPFVAANLDSDNAAHRLAARGVLFLLANIPTLQNDLGCLATLLASSLGVFILILGVRSLRLGAVASAATEAASSLRRQLHRQMYRLGQSALPTEGTGPVANIFSREVNDVRDALQAELDSRWTVPLLLSGLLLTCLLTSWIPTIFIAALGGLAWIAARALDNASKVRSTGASHDLALSYTMLQEDLSLLRTVRVHGVENVDRDRFDEHVQRHRAADRRRLVIDGQSTNRLALLLGIAATLGLGILVHSVVVRGDAPASALLIMSAIRVAMPGVSNWIRSLGILRQGSRSASGIAEYLEKAPELQQAVGAQFVPPMKQRISFENVTLHNARGRAILEGFSAEIPAGSRTAVMSLDEEAMHAVACLIPRLIDPRTGRVRIDGLDLREVTLESLRAQVGLVLQADLAFSDSVFANIALGDPAHDLPRVIEAAKIAHAHQFIQDLPHGYDTQIGPMGEYLSMDMQYRIGLARAILHDPSIVILEEPTSTLDDEIKPLLDDTVDRLAAHRTLVILPHRLSTIRRCDQVLVIHNGHLEVSGPPRDLHASSKLFRHLEYVEFNQFATGEIEAGQMNG